MSIDVRPLDVTAAASVDVPDPAPWTDAQLLVLQHPALGQVRFSCRCAGCHHQILSRRFCPELADAWMAVRGDLVDPADVPRP
ncbi:hypothetical protein FHX74_001310 [Friedmanniella endophytica]|uniref:Uncharacterized protein n=1 Tax=Microlunatus kandeliicorticis TaxID=1759536 RepID=A0A7W3IR73_9ACTN|nr:hypothetical protein [Microlunatus kandeliicorticis]MBA8793705.1 hypothetical protein [Microlunatus kandeliicorticis]